MTEHLMYLVLIQIALVVPSFFFFRFVFRKIHSTNRKVFSFASTALFHVLLFWLILEINSELIYPWIRSDKFDSQKWISQKSMRYKMVNDIVNTDLLIGKTKEEVMMLLGNDIEKGPCDECFGYSTNDPDQGFSIDHEVIEIEFDNHNIVNSVKLNLW